MARELLCICKHITGGWKMANDQVKHFLCTGTFDDSMLKDFMKFYSEILKDGDKQAIIYIDSNGGNVRTANSMISIIENSGIDFYTCALGSASSSALALLVSGKKRFAAPRSRMLFHDVSTGAFGKVDEVKQQATESKELSKRYIKYFSSKTKKPASWWLATAKKKETKDFVFYPKTALKLGVIDRIGLPEVIITKKVA